MTTFVVPAEIFDRLEYELIRAGLGHRRLDDTGEIDLTDISISRGDHSGLTKPPKRRRSTP